MRVLIQQVGGRTVRSPFLAGSPVSECNSPFFSCDSDFQVTLRCYVDLSIHPHPTRIQSLTFRTWNVSPLLSMDQNITIPKCSLPTPVSFIFSLLSSHKLTFNSCVDVPTGFHVYWFLYNQIINLFRWELYPHFLQFWMCVKWLINTCRLRKSAHGRLFHSWWWGS